MTPISNIFSEMSWQRAVVSLNIMLFGYPYRSYDAAPDGVLESFTYYDTTLQKVRTWDGSAWQDHW